MKVNEYLPNLDVEALVWLDALERFYRPWQMAYFRPFSNVISIKTSRAARKKYLQYGRGPYMTIWRADVRRWCHRVTSLQVLYWQGLSVTQNISTSTLKGDTEIAKKISKWSKPTDMTIHWKALEHILIIPVSWLKYLLVKIIMHFLKFSQNIQSLKS
jgi:hypothetical protein